MLPSVDGCVKAAVYLLHVSGVVGGHGAVVARAARVVSAVVAGEGVRGRERGERRGRGGGVEARAEHGVVAARVAGVAGGRHVPGVAGVHRLHLETLHHHHPLLLLLLLLLSRDVVTAVVRATLAR